MNDRFFIFDCNGDIVGNPKGYRTIRGAIQQQSQKGSPAWRAIWAAYEEKKKENPAHCGLSEIRMRGDA
jgi:hypothetical protein